MKTLFNKRILRYEKTMRSVATIRIGTRKSALALVQANTVAAALKAAHPSLAEQGMLEIVPLITSGDKLSGSLMELGGKGLFTKEIEEALLAGTLDIAVHSMKDMLTVLPPGLVIGAMLPREDPRDVLITKDGKGSASFGAHTTFGTASLRRTAQLRLRWPGCRMVNLRGNVATRIDKVRRGEADATLLALAGLKRLNVNLADAEIMPVSSFLPAVGQGAIGIECRAGDASVLHMLAAVNHADTVAAVTAERAMLAVLDGSCRTPIAGLAEIRNGTLHLSGFVARPDGSRHHTTDVQGQIDDAATLGREAGERLFALAGKHFFDEM
jgi:hydroxymethylbilane synthase